MNDGGFSSVTRLGEAREQLLKCCVSHDRTALLAVGDAVGHVLADPVAAERAVPHYDRAAMDGFAVRARDTFDASERSPVSLSPAEDRVETGSAVPVHTGSEIPPGADAVVRVEQTDHREGELLVSDAVAAGENVAPTGEDVELGETLFDSGHRLCASDLALLRGAGVETVSAVEHPRVSVLPTGEELVPARTVPGPGEVVETNGLLVSTLAKRWGGDPSYRDVVTDDSSALRVAIEADTDHDVVVTTGGSSLGERDLIADVVADAGEVLVHGVAIEPGLPVGFGVVEQTPVLMLPGYPVACLVAAVQFLRPALSWLAGTTPRPHPTVRGRLTEKLPSSPGKRSFARVRIHEDVPLAANVDPTGVEDDGGLPDVEPLRTSGAGALSSVTEADGWVEIPESREDIPAGERVTVQQWERVDYAGR